MIQLDDKLEFNFNTIFVIESLPDNETKTGKMLVTDILRRMEFLVPELEVVYIEVSSLEELILEFNQINQSCKSGTLPLIHFEFHGSPDGVELANGYFFPWTSLATYLRDINRSCDNNLLVTLASCFGAYLFKGIDPTEFSPFWGFIGPWEETFEGEIELSFTEFYSTLLTTFDINSALDAFKMHNAMSFKFHHAELVFEKVWEDYRKKVNDPRHLEERLNRLYGIALSRNLIKPNQKEKWMDETKVKIQDIDTSFEKTKSNFLNK